MVEKAPVKSSTNREKPRNKLPLNTLWLILSLSFLVYYPVYELQVLGNLHPLDITLAGAFAFVILILYMTFSQPRKSK